MVVPSAWEETFGLVAVEAMAAGVPPLAPAHGSFPELVTDGRDGVLFEPGDPGSLARGLADVDRCPEHFAGLGRAARTTYQTRFQEATNVQQLVAVYRFAVEHPAGTADRGRAGAPS